VLTFAQFAAAEMTLDEALKPSKGPKFKRAKINSVVPRQKKIATPGLKMKRPPKAGGGGGKSGFLHSLMPNPPKSPLPGVPKKTKKGVKNPFLPKKPKPLLNKAKGFVKGKLDKGKKVAMNKLPGANFIKKPKPLPTMLGGMVRKALGFGPKPKKKTS
jgi:hypothetical protein